MLAFVSSEHINMLLFNGPTCVASKEIAGHRSRADGDDRGTGQGEGHRITGRQRARHDDQEDGKKDEFHGSVPRR